MRTFSLIALLCALAIPVAGCGDDDEDTSGGSGGDSAEQPSAGYSGGGGGKDDTAKSGGGRKAQTLKISADPGGALAFDKSSLSA